MDIYLNASDMPYLGSHLGPFLYALPEGFVLFIIITLVLAPYGNGFFRAFFSSFVPHD